jgi:hypothetical protein
VTNSYPPNGLLLMAMPTAQLIAGTPSTSAASTRQPI